MKPSTKTPFLLSINFLLIIALQATAFSPSNGYAQDNSAQSFLLQDNVWEQLVLPGNPVGTTVATLFGDQLQVDGYGDKWIVYTYDGAGMKYVNPGLDGSINQAEGFWIFQRTGVDIELNFPAGFTNAALAQSANCNSPAGCAEIALATSPGKNAWTMGGIPYKESVPTDQISVVTDSAGSNCINGCTLDEAAAANYTSNQLWRYDSATNSYVDQKSEATLNPLQAFWMQTFSAADSTNPVVLLPKQGSNPSTLILPGIPQAYQYDGKEILVNNGTELQSAISSAQPGDVITVSNGLYLLGNKVSLNANGTASKPITLRATDNRQTEINFSQLNGIVEGFLVLGKHWTIDGFVLSSDCRPQEHSRCEHAIHVKSNAEGLIIRNNKIVDFNAAIKGGGNNNVFANNVRIEHNEIFNSSVRMTSNPVTPIDINGGDGWLIAKNSIYDFAKGLGNQVSYGAFLKANSSNGVMDSNWLQCKKNVTAPGPRIGLSFGGGGNSPINSSICKDSDCSHLHRNGRMMNNLITNCSDVGIYINASSDSLIDHNTLFSTAGIDIRFQTSTARIIANILVDGDISERNGGQVTQNEANVLKSKAEVPTLSNSLNTIGPHSVTDPPLNYDICSYARPTMLVGAIGGTAAERGICVDGLL